MDFQKILIFLHVSLLLDQLNAFPSAQKGASSSTVVISHGQKGSRQTWLSVARESVCTVDRQNLARRTKIYFLNKTC